MAKKLQGTFVPKKRVKRRFKKHPHKKKLGPKER